MTQPTMKHELKPCPFCGGEAELWQAHKDRAAWVACMGRCAVLVSRGYQETDQAVAAWNTRAPVPKIAAMVDTFYIDCEFDGHDGPLLSIAMVRGDGYSLYARVNANAFDPWVIANVIPIMDAHKADVMRKSDPHDVGSVLQQFIGDCTTPTIIADSPVDIGRFCRAISTGKDGKWQSVEFSQMQLIVQNVDCYPTTLEGAVQHNAWWDAMALRAALDAMREARK